ncbi:MAG: hypothetical protein NC938_07365 [Candidatus Omnitrophica bacterium]|nr:hypothetical protein [Candidatus Omnitrophota bacterium]
MKRYTALFVAIVFIAISFVAIPVYAQDNALDRIGDWWATRGKQEPEKSMILMKRKSEREAKRFGKNMEKQAAKMQKGFKGAFGK